MAENRRLIRDQLPLYISPEDMEAAGEGSILEYLHAKYGAPEKNAVAADLTDHVFNMQGRVVHFFERSSTGELLGVGGIQARLRVCTTPGLAGSLITNASATVGVPRMILLGLQTAIATATLLAFIDGADFPTARLLCDALCGRDCTCVPLPFISSGPDVTVRTFWGFLPYSVTVDMIVTTDVFCV